MGFGITIFNVLAIALLPSEKEKVADVELKFWTGKEFLTTEDKKQGKSVFGMLFPFKMYFFAHTACKTDERGGVC